MAQHREAEQEAVRAMGSGARICGITKKERVVRIEKFSHAVARNWKEEIALLLRDGHYAEQDWNRWKKFVKLGGRAIFHDACRCEGGRTSAGYGPVKLIDQFAGNGKVERWSVAEEVHSLFVRDGMLNAMIDNERRENDQSWN